MGEKGDNRFSVCFPGRDERGDEGFRIKEGRKTTRVLRSARLHSSSKVFRIDDGMQARSLDGTRKSLVTFFCIALMSFCLVLLLPPLLSRPLGAISSRRVGSSNCSIGVYCCCPVRCAISRRGIILSRKRRASTSSASSGAVFGTHINQVACG